MSKLNKLIEKFLANPPEARFEDVQYVLEAFGFEEKRSKGSHHIFALDEGRVLTLPKKGGKKVKKAYIKKVTILLNLEEWYSQTQADDRPQHQNIENNDKPENDQQPDSDRST